ncbi:MAG: AMP-binding protein, partial [Pseudomonadota bacterium]
MTTLSALLLTHPDASPALGAPGRDWLDYGGLRALAYDVADALHGAGIGRGDRVAIVLPNGPEMAAAFITVAQAATTAPLNPAYRQEEFEFYLEDLKAKAIILPDGYDGPALPAAEKFGLTILRLSFDASKPAGTFVLATEASGAPADRGQPQADDVALILHTSGTTSRPKIVPLLHSNVAASAQNIGGSLALSSDDRCLNVMPLFHIHGLVAAVASSLAAGGQVWCAPGFDALKFFGWLADAKPTWYTAVPTMHQTILARASRNADTIASANLRFLRSSSASLPPQVMTSLTDTFGAPVIEGYGMTEAA